MKSIKTSPALTAGFTLPEVMAVVAILGILAALAMPSFTELIESQRAKNAAADLYIALMRARSEAIKRNTDMTLSSKAGNWANGWQMTDPASGAVIEDHEALRGLSVTGQNDVVYRSSGRITGGAGTSFIISGTSVSSARWICLDLSGRPSVRASAC